MPPFCSIVIGPQQELDGASAGVADGPQQEEEPWMAFAYRDFTASLISAWLNSFALMSFSSHHAEASGSSKPLSASRACMRTRPLFTAIATAIVSRIAPSEIPCSLATPR